MADALNIAQGNYENTFAALNNIIGLSTDTNLIIDEELSYLPYEIGEAECLNYALEHRLNGNAVVYSVKQAEAAVNATKNVSAVIQGSMSGKGAFKAGHKREMWESGLQLNNNVTSAQNNERLNLRHDNSLNRFA